MENPESWDSLTACLAACRLDDLAESWAFLVHVGVVREGAGGRERFEAVVADVLAEGPITGPSEALRIALRLARAGIAWGPAAAASDPWGKSAQVRLERFRAARGK